eukprot:384075_1
MMMLVILLILLCIYAQSDPTIVETEYGSIRGLLFPSENVRVFRSIPFAAPPIDELRWTNPQPPKSWKTTLDCTKEIVGCAQSCNPVPLEPYPPCPPIKTEDCLYLNVFTTINANTTSNIPVLIFIHGGSFETGYSGGLGYNGTTMVNVTGKIVVTINYRLGVLGALYDSSIALEGNYGYFDQVYAIEWTHRNIKNFGGDPTKLLIFGESAGAHSVALHLLNKTSVISGGIMESAPVGSPLRTAKTWGTLPYTFSNQLGCNTSQLSPKDRLKCLRSKNTSQIIDIQTKSARDDPGAAMLTIQPWTPTVGAINSNNDSVFIDQPLFAFQNGDYNTNIPFIAGSNEGEGFLADVLPNVSYNEIRAILGLYFGVVDAERIELFYNVTDDNRNDNFFETEGNITTDWLFRCSARNLIKSSIKHATLSDNIGYFYHFNYISAEIKDSTYELPQCWTHVCHGEELPFVFNPHEIFKLIQLNYNETLLSHQIQFYWTNMAETGNPSNGKHENDLNKKWLNYNSNLLQQTLMINNIGINGIVMDNSVDQSICDFWDNLDYNWMRE